MPEQQNSIADLKKYFSTSERPVSTSEMMEFWNVCSEAEKNEFKSAELK